MLLFVWAWKIFQGNRVWGGWEVFGIFGPEHTLSIVVLEMGGMVINFVIYIRMKSGTF